MRLEERGENKFYILVVRSHRENVYYGLPAYRLPALPTACLPVGRAGRRGYGLGVANEDLGDLREAWDLKNLTN